jgi:hypothetical protein
VAEKRWSILSVLSAPGNIGPNHLYQANAETFAIAGEKDLSGGQALRHLTQRSCAGHLEKVLVANSIAFPLFSGLALTQKKTPDCRSSFCIWYGLLTKRVDHLALLMPGRFVLIARLPMIHPLVVTVLSAECYRLLPQDQDFGQVAEKKYHDRPVEAEGTWQTHTTCRSLYK